MVGHAQRTKDVEDGAGIQMEKRGTTEKIHGCSEGACRTFSQSPVGTKLPKACRGLVQRKMVGSDP